MEESGLSGDTEAMSLFYSRDLATQLENAKLEVKALSKIYGVHVHLYFSVCAVLKDPEPKDREKVRRVYRMMREAYAKGDEIFMDCTRKVKKDPDLL